MKRMFALILFTLFASPLLAQQTDDVTLTLTTPSPTAEPGDVVQFYATAVNNTNVTINFNSDSISADPLLAVDDTPFQSSWFYVDPNGTFGPDELFDVTVGPSAGPGTYYGTFTLLGGPGAMDQGNIGSADFSVTVPGAATPEPGSLSLALLGATVMAGRLRRRHQSRNV